DGTPLGLQVTAVQRGFIDAAAGVETVDKIDPALVEQIVRGVPKSWLADDPEYLGRLAWVCQRLKKYDQAAELVRRLLDREPQSQELRERYVGLLPDAGRATDAPRHLHPLEA